MILLDTSILSRALRRRRPGAAEEGVRIALDQLLAADPELGLPGIVLQEVLSGVRDESQYATLRHHLLTSFTIVLSTIEDHIAAAVLRNACLQKGLNVSGIDCLIAAIAIAGGHRLLAEDEDFRAIARHSKLAVISIDDLGS